MNVIRIGVTHVACAVGMSTHEGEFGFWAAMFAIRILATKFRESSPRAAPLKSGESSFDFVIELSSAYRHISPFSVNLICSTARRTNPRVCGRRFRYFIRLTFRVRRAVAALLSFAAAATHSVSKSFHLESPGDLFLKEKTKNETHS